MQILGSYFVSLEYMGLYDMEEIVRFVGNMAEKLKYAYIGR